MINNIYYLEGDVNKTMYDNLRDFFKKLRKEGSPDIILEIESAGGGSDWSRLICSLIDNYDGRVTGVAKSHCMSAAFIILQKCEKRVMFENCALKTHEIAFEFNQRLTGTFLNKLLSGDKKAVKLFSSVAKDIKRSDLEFSSFVAKRSGGKITKKKFYKLMQKDKNIFAKKALKYGLIDEIIPHFWFNLPSYILCSVYFFMLKLTYVF